MLQLPHDQVAFPVAWHGANLVLEGLRAAAEPAFRAADGAREDTARRSANMRSLLSSSALAVNFFDAWREAGLADLGKALGLGASSVTLRFKCKLVRYPVGPRSPNFELLLSLDGGLCLRTVL